MAFSIYAVNATAGQTQFTISFGLGYIDKADVKCRVNKEVDGLGQPVYRTLTWITDDLVQVGGTALVLNDLVEFIRTVSKTSLVHDYSDGVEIQEKNLDDSNKQTLMAVQEVLDGRFESGLATDLDFANHKAINVATGTDPTDAVNVAQLQDMTGNAPAYAAAAAASAVTANTAKTDAQTAATNAANAQAAAEAAANGMKWRPTVRFATTVNDTLSGLAVRNGITPVAGNRVLVMNQSTPAQNGVYIAAAGAWTRATDADSWTELVGMVVVTEEASTIAGQSDVPYICTVNSGGTLGTTAVTFTIIPPILLDGGVSTAAKIVDGIITFAKMATSAVALLADVVANTTNKFVTSDVLRTYLGAWVAYTPIITHSNGGVTNVTITGKWRRVGDSIEVVGMAVFSAAPAAFTDWVVSLPAGLTVDAAKLNGSTSVPIPVGQGLVTDTGVNFHQCLIFCGGGSILQLYALNANVTYVGAASLTASVPIAFGNTDAISWHATLPIVGW